MGNLTQNNTTSTTLPLNELEEKKKEYLQSANAKVNTNTSSHIEQARPLLNHPDPADKLSQQITFYELEIGRLDRKGDQLQKVLDDIETRENQEVAKGHAVMAGIYGNKVRRFKEQIKGVEDTVQQDINKLDRLEEDLRSSLGSVNESRRAGRNVVGPRKLNVRRFGAVDVIDGLRKRIEFEEHKLHPNQTTIKLLSEKVSELKKIMK
jgi:hypothetical protein